jgi:hypothetical protein
MPFGILAAAVIGGLASHLSNDNEENVQNVRILCAGGGYYVFYYLGIFKFMQEHYDLTDCVFSGVSAGILPCLALSAGISIDLALNKMLELNERLKDGVFNKIYDYMRDLLNHFITADILKKINGKLYVTLLEVPAYNYVTINSWTSKEDLIDCIIASSFLPNLLTSQPYSLFRGRKFIDGGIMRPIPQLPGPGLDIVISANKYKPIRFKGLLDYVAFKIPTYSATEPYELFEKGYNDAIVHKSEFENVLQKQCRQQMRLIRCEHQ